LEQPDVRCSSFVSVLHAPHAGIWHAGIWHVAHADVLMKGAGLPMFLPVDVCVCCDRSPTVRTSSD